MRRGENVIPRFWQFYDKIVDTCNEGGNILIHCRAGAHRAGTASAAFGMMAFHYTAREAVRWVRERRSVTSVDGDNYMLLLRLQKEVEEAFADTAPRASGETRVWRITPAAPAASSEPDVEEADPERARAPSPPRDEPPRAVLTPAQPTPQDLESAAPGIYDVLPHDEEEDDARAELDRKWASVRITSTDYTEEDHDAAAALSEEENAAPSAAPAARLPYREATGRLAFMSWNAGGGARNLAHVLDTVGNNILAVQEAHADQLSALCLDTLLRTPEPPFPSPVGCPSDPPSPHALALHLGPAAAPAAPQLPCAPRSPRVACCVSILRPWTSAGPGPWPRTSGLRPKSPWR